jgi:hypothetical protein
LKLPWNEKFSTLLAFETQGAGIKVKQLLRFCAFDLVESRVCQTH